MNASQQTSQHSTHLTSFSHTRLPFSLSDQTTLGHRYISQQFGVQPTTTWQIDPFGHSSTQAALFGQLSAIDGVFFARIDFQDKARRSAARELEMIWRASESLGSKAQVFAGAFAAGFGYGPPTGFCWDRGCRNPAIQNNKSLPGYNLDTFVDAFVATAQRQANETNGNNVMWTLGNDFEVSHFSISIARKTKQSSVLLPPSSLCLSFLPCSPCSLCLYCVMLFLLPKQYTEAELWYANLDKLIDGVNADGRVKTLYSTPSIYLAAKNAEGISWPLKTDDFFPCQHTHTHINHRLVYCSLHSTALGRPWMLMLFVCYCLCLNVCAMGCGRCG